MANLKPPAAMIDIPASLDPVSWLRVCKTVEKGKHNVGEKFVQASASSHAKDDVKMNSLEQFLWKSWSLFCAWYCLRTRVFVLGEVERKGNKKVK